MILLTITSLAVLIQLASTTSDVPEIEYNKLIKKLENLISIRDELNEDYTNISNIFNDSESYKSKELTNKCDKYEKNRRTYIENITDINNFIDMYKLSYHRPTLKTHSLLNVAKLQESLNLTLITCNVTIRKMLLLEDLHHLNKFNTEANIISNQIDGKNLTIKLSDIRNKAIPIKECILEKIQTDIKEIYLIKEYCEEHNVTKLCGTTVLDIPYWEELQSKIIGDLLKLEKVVVVYIFINYVQPILYILVFIFGFAGNTVLLVIFFRNEKFRKPQNMIIFNLALADTLSLIVNLPLNHAFEKIGRGDKDAVLVAQIFNFSRYVCLGLSVFSTVALCLQRFSATLKASNYVGFVLRQSTSVSAKKVITIVWIVAIIFAIPRGLHGDIYIYEKYDIRKKMYKIPVQVVTTLELIVLSIIPSIIIIILSWFTVRHFQERARKIPADIPDRHRTYQLDVLSRTTKVIMLSPLVFCCTSLPFFFFYCLRNFFELDINSLPDTVMKVISTTLLFVSCSFNPIGFYVASGNFRRCMREMFGLGPRKNSIKYTQHQCQQSKCDSNENKILDTSL